MLLTEQEIREAHEKHSNEFLFEDAINFARAIESAILAKIKEQRPVAWQNITNGAVFIDLDESATRCPAYLAGELLPLYRLPEGD